MSFLKKKNHLFYPHHVFIDAIHSSCLPLIISRLFLELLHEKSFLKSPDSLKQKNGDGLPSRPSLLSFSGTLMTLTTPHFKRMLCFRAVLTTFCVLETHSGLSASGNTAPFPRHHGLSSGRQTSSQAFFCVFFSFCCRVKLSGRKTGFPSLTSILNPRPKILQSFNGKAEGSW